MVEPDPAGVLYVGDSLNHRIRWVDSQGRTCTLAGSGADASQEGSGDVAQVHDPIGLALAHGAPGHTLYVSDSAGHNIRKLTWP